MKLLAKHRVSLRVMLIGICAIILVACGSRTDTEEPEITETAIQPTPTQLGVNQPTPNPSEEAIPEVTSLLLWWPDELAPAGNDVNILLNNQIQAFGDAEGNLEIDFRLKTMQELGGIMSTLRTAIVVAPSTLPDITIIRREDLISAVTNNLIQPMSGVASPSPTIISDLYDIAIELGEYDADGAGEGTSQLYGLPYLLDVTHLTYLNDADNETAINWSFNDILTQNQAFLFPAGQTTGVNRTFWMQYFSAGGVIPNEANNFEINETALLETLSFYEQLAESQLITSNVFTYTSPNDYLELMTTGEVSAAVVRTSQYFNLRLSDEAWEIAPIPTSSGGNVAMINAWMWVIVTPDPERQAIAARFIDWMMDVQRQQEYAEVIYRLPSQESALLSMNSDLIDANRMSELIESAYLTLPESEGGILARTMHDALMRVINGESTAEEATQAVLTIAENERD